MISTPVLQRPVAANDCYAFLEWQSNEVTRSLVGFTGLITPVPDNLSSVQWQGLEARYATIKEWQSTTLELFSASLKGLATPAIAELFLREIPPYLVILLIIATSSRPPPSIRRCSFARTKRHLARSSRCSRPVRCGGHMSSCKTITGRRVFRWAQIYPRSGLDH
jgi:hypothetical protein